MIVHAMSVNVDSIRVIVRYVLKDVNLEWLEMGFAIQYVRFAIVRMMQVIVVVFVGLLRKSTMQLNRSFIPIVALSGTVMDFAIVSV